MYDRDPVKYKDLVGFDGNTALVIEYAASLRKLWSRDHEDTHSPKQHAQLAASGHFLTPEAAYKLAPFGVIDVTSLLFSDEHICAYREAPRAPSDDAIY